MPRRVNKDAQPITRDGVLLQVGDKVYTHTGQAARDSEVVYIDGGSVVVRDKRGEIDAVKAWLCWGRNEAMLEVQREHAERRLQEMKAMIAAIPACEAKLVELNTSIAAMQEQAPTPSSERT